MSLSKSLGSYEISTRILGMSVDSITKTLCRIFNRSIMYEEIPDTETAGLTYTNIKKREKKEIQARRAKKKKGARDRGRSYLPKTEQLMRSQMKTNRTDNKK